MRQKEYFYVSESFYSMAFETSNHEIFDFYDIGSWNINVVERYKNINPAIFNHYLLKLIQFLPWITVKEIGLRSNIGKWQEKESNLNYQDWLCSIENSDYDKSDFFMDLGQAFFNYNLIKNGNVINLNTKCGIIYFSFDSAYQKIEFNINLNIDLFTANPSRQPNVFLSESEFVHNNSLLANSLEEIDRSDIFKISDFSSDFYPDKIYKYGFFR